MSKRELFHVCAKTALHSAHPNPKSGHSLGAWNSPYFHLCRVAPRHRPFRQSRPLRPVALLLRSRSSRGSPMILGPTHQVALLLRSRSSSGPTVILGRTPRCCLLGPVSLSPTCRAHLLLLLLHHRRATRAHLIHLLQLRLVRAVRYLILICQSVINC